MRQLKITKQVTSREHISLDKYLQDIGREELITAEEEVRLAQRIKQGDRKALNRLTKVNLRFVVLGSQTYINDQTPKNKIQTISKHQKPNSKILYSFKYFLPRNSSGK